MRAQHIVWNSQSGWRTKGEVGDPSLLLFFGARQALACGSTHVELRAMFPSAHIWAAAPAGRSSDDVTDDEIAVAARCGSSDALASRLRSRRRRINSRSCGEAIGRALAAEDLAGIFVLSDGLNVNGSELVAGMTSAVDRRSRSPAVWRAMAPNFRKPRRRRLRAAQADGCRVGFYGPPSASAMAAPAVGMNSEPRRRITRSRGNVLFELDGEPALDLYERYLGEDDVKGLPGTALLFPLRIRNPGRPDHDIVRTSWRSTQGPLDDLCGRRAGGLGRAIDARQLRSPGRRRRQGRPAGRGQQPGTA